MTRVQALMSFVFAASLGCEPDEPPGPGTTGGPTSSATTEADSSTTGAHATSDGGDATTGVDVCHGTSFCGAGFCVAPYADNDRGSFDCVDACVGPDDESHWCYDDAACCDPTAVCTIRGYCVVPGDSSSSDGSSGSDGSGSGSGSGSTSISGSSSGGV